MVFSWLVAIGLAGQLDPGALVPLYRQALTAQEKQFGPEHPKVARSASDLGLYLRNLGDQEGAAEHLARALKIDAKTLGPSDPLVSQDLETLASVAPAEHALPLYRKAAECSDAGIQRPELG